MADEKLPVPIRSEPSPEPATPSDSIVEAWFADSFHNLGLSTPLFNRFSAAKDDLKSRLRAALRKG